MAVWIDPKNVEYVVNASTLTIQNPKSNLASIAQGRSTNAVNYLPEGIQGARYHVVANSKGARNSARNSSSSDSLRIGHHVLTDSTAVCTSLGAHTNLDIECFDANERAIVSVSPWKTRKGYHQGVSTREDLGFGGRSTWSTIISTDTPRWGPAAALQNGYLMEGFGYENTTSTYVNKMYKFNPDVPSWSTVSSATTQRFSPEAFTLSDYSYWVAGSAATYLATNEEYEALIDDWQTRAALTTARTCPIGVELNGFGYVLCGRPTSGYDSPNYKYSKFVNEWETKTPPFTGVYLEGGSGAELNGYLAIVAGFWNTGSGSGYWDLGSFYEDLTDTWRASIPTQTDQFMYTRSVNHTNYLYQIGGYSGSALSSNTKAYNVWASAWSSGASLPSARIVGGTGHLDGYVYCRAGFDAMWTMTDDTIEYN